MIPKSAQIFILFLTILLSLPFYRTWAFDNSSKYIGNPVFAPDINSWDNVAVIAPFVMFHNGIYKMWYAGFNGSQWLFGYAESPDGITNWSRVNHPIIPIASNIHSAGPAVVFNGTYYEMWFVSASPAEINYATSLNGIDWTIYPQSVIRPDQPWERAGLADPWVVKVGGVYKMWYTANDGSQWLIGYAESTDGINWNKAASNPVLIPEDSEYPTVARPSVIFDDNKYVMFYHASHPATKINMAVSSDGITWLRSPNNPILTTTGTGFDAEMIVTPSLLRTPQGYMLWYGGLGTINNVRAWRIGLASDTTLPFPTPPPTPTPTPTPIPTTKVVVVPGFGGSWNADAILNCKAESPDHWTSWTPADWIYNPIYDSLKTVGGWVPEPFYYDWRKQIADTSPLLKDFIDSKVVTNEKVNIVGHSMGGLIGRAYIETEKFDNKADKFMSVGAPHQGTLWAYPAWSAGEVWGNLLWKIAATAVLKNCPNTGISNRETIRQFIPSIQNFLPIFGYIKNRKTGEVTSVNKMNAQNNLYQLPRDEFMLNYNTAVGALSGFGFDTLRYFDINKTKDTLVGNGDWLDGKPVKEEYFDGDGTVLKESSTLYNYPTKFLNKNHSELISSAEGIAEIQYFLSAGKITPFQKTQSAFVEPKSSLLIIGHPANFWVLSPDNKPQQSKDSLVAFMNPKAGSYKLVLAPKTANTRIEIGQFLENGQILWKEYKHSGLLPKIGTINFNPANPVEDALK